MQRLRTHVAYIAAARVLSSHVLPMGVLAALSYGTVLAVSRGENAPSETPAAVSAAGPSTVAFVVGQAVEVRAAGEWQRGCIAAIHRVEAVHGGRVAYEVQLDRGGRGLQAASTLRRPRA